jgi:hypothetical protein
MIETNATVTTVGGFLTTSTILSNMVIFKDSFYMHLIILGISLSIFGAVHELLESDYSKTKRKIISSIIKSSVLGGILTPIYFFTIDKYMDYPLELTYGTSLIFAWYSIPIWNKVVELLSLVYKEVKDTFAEVLVEKMEKMSDKFKR